MTANETTYVPGQLTDSMLESARGFTRAFFQRNPGIYLFPDGSFMEDTGGDADAAHFYSELLAQIRSLVANEQLLIQETDAYIDQAYEATKDIAAHRDGYKDANERRELLERAQHEPTEADDKFFLVCEHSEDGRMYLSAGGCTYGPLYDPTFKLAIYAHHPDAQRMVDKCIRERNRAEAEVRRQVGPESTPYDDLPGGPTYYYVRAMKYSEWAALLIEREQNLAGIEADEAALDEQYRKLGMEDG